MSGESILIVEDERIVAMDLQRTLRDLGYDAYAVASSADQAMSIATERVPDLAMMDIRLRGQVDGVEAARLLRDQLGVPVVFLTAHADKATLDRAKLSEPFGYLLKPFRAAELRSVVEIALFKHSTEKKLLTRERWLQATLSSIPDGVVLIDSDGCVSFVNPAAQKLIGSDETKLLSLPIARLFESGVLTGDELERIEEAIFMRRVEARMNLRVGLERRFVECQCSPVMDISRNELLGAIFVLRDTTERLQLQRKMEETERLASLGTMAAGTVHEVNNPLSVVIANAELMLAELHEQGTTGEAADLTLDRIRSSLDDVLVAAQRISRVMEDLRTFYRPHSQREDAADVHAAVSWAVRSTAHEVRARAKLTTELAPVPLAALPESKLSQVLVNLIVNASHAIEVGEADANEIRIRVGLDEGRERVILTVRDTGSGIPPEVLKHVFEPFFTTKPIGRGSGLGLAICFGIVQSAAGEITVQSEVGVGTTFEIRLPVADPKVVPSARPSAPEVARRLKILLVDDEVALLRVMRRVFSEHDVVCAEGGRAALAALEEADDFDVIFSDLTMPHMSGAKLYRTLLAQRPECVRRMIFVSGGSLSHEDDEFLAGVAGLVHVAKPFEPSDLFDALGRKLAQLRGGAG